MIRNFRQTISIEICRQQKTSSEMKCLHAKFRNRKRKNHKKKVAFKNGTWKNDSKMQLPR